MEHLDKLMYNAYEGSCVTLPLVPKVLVTHETTGTCDSEAQLVAPVSSLPKL